MSSNFWRGFIKQATVANIIRHPELPHHARWTPKVKFETNTPEPAEIAESFHPTHAETVELQDDAGNYVSQAVLRHFRDPSKKDVIMLHTLKTPKEHQGKGYGRELLTYIRSIYPHRHVLLTTDPNVGAKNKTHDELKQFYAKSGAIHLSTSNEGQHWMAFPRTSSVTPKMLLGDVPEDFELRDQEGMHKAAFWVGFEKMANKGNPLVGAMPGIKSGISGKGGTLPAAKPSSGVSIAARSQAPQLPLPAPVHAKHNLAATKPPVTAPAVAIPKQSGNGAPSSTI